VWSHGSPVHTYGFRDRGYVENGEEEEGECDEGRNSGHCWSEFGNFEETVKGLVVFVVLLLVVVLVENVLSSVFEFIY